MMRASELGALAAADLLLVIPSYRRCAAGTARALGWTPASPMLAKSLLVVFDAFLIYTA
jgi:hypothetical protein